MGACPHVRRWTLVVVLACGSGAAADDLDDARTAVDGSDYVTARAALDKALHAGSAGPEELAEIYKLTGIVEGALGNSAPATGAFARWLELDPKGVLPAGTSPKITRPFKAAADQAKQHKPLEVQAHTVAQPPSVSLEVKNDAQNLVASAHVIVVVDGGTDKARDGKPGTAIDLPAGHRLDLRVQALDEYGNRVYELGSKSVPLVITGAERDDDRANRHVAPQPKKLLLPPEPEVQHPRPWYLHHVTWGITTVVMAGAAGFFAYETKSDLDQLDALNRTSLDHVYGEAQTVEANAKRDVLIADIAAGAAGAFALGTAVLYLTRPRAMETAVHAVPTRDGAAIVVGGHF